jgi:hypothetical protein
MRQLSASQLDQIERDNTRPIYLLEWQFDGTPEYLSSNGQIEFNGETWVPGISVTMENWATATITLSPTSDRAAVLNSGQWRFQPAVIYFVPSNPQAGAPITTDTDIPVLTDNGEPIVFGDGFEQEVVLLNGIITGGRVSASSLQMTITHRAINGVRSPRTRLSGPRAGTVVEWEGEVYVIEGRR